MKSSRLHDQQHAVPAGKAAQSPALTDPEDGRPLRFLPEILRLATEPHYSPMAGMDTAGMIRWHGSRLRGEQAMRMATDAQSR